MRDGLIARQFHTAGNRFSRMYRLFFHAQILPRWSPRPCIGAQPSASNAVDLAPHLPPRPWLHLRHQSTPVIPTGAGRRICSSASLLRSSRPAKWRDLSSLIIAVKTQFEGNTDAKQKRLENFLRAVYYRIFRVTTKLE
jgi:hypothetical protein